MAIKTSTFSGWRLSGEDARAFLEQIENPEPNILAQCAVEQGKELIDEYIKKGYASIKPIENEKNLDKA